MPSKISFSSAPELTGDDYVVIGLATCFLRQEGETHEVKILEPIPSAALEAVLKGIPTSYQMAWATTLDQVLEGDNPKSMPEFPPEAQFSDEFANRTIAAARTYKAKPSAQSYIALGTAFHEFNFSLDRKRILNSQRIVRTEDNVKQHQYTHQVL